MPTYHMTFDLNNADDVQVICERLKTICQNMMPEEKPKNDYEGAIYEDELCKILKRGSKTIAKFRMEGMPYYPGKPCTYPKVEAEAWFRKYKMLGKK